jgi:hypothetical protein
VSASNYVHLEVERIQRVTDKALLLLLKDGEEVWIPLSQVADGYDYQEGDENCTVSVTEWIAELEGKRPCVTSCRPCS